MARGCSPLCRWPAPVRVGWPAMLAAVVVLGGACGGGTLKIPAQLDFYGPGTHSWPYWQRDLHHAWPLLQHALGAG